MMATARWVITAMLVARATAAQCMKDTDCKPDRLCERGECVDAPKRTDGAARRPPQFALIDRPLTLARGAVAPSLRFDVYNVGQTSNGTTVSGTGTSMVLGLDGGVTEHLQLGLVLAFPIDPNAGFGTLLASAQYGFTDSAAVRLDAATIARCVPLKARVLGPVSQSFTSNGQVNTTTVQASDYAAARVISFFVNGRF